MFKTLQRYVGDRFNLPHEGLTRPELEQHLRRRGAPDQLARDVEALCEQCDAARFAPESVASGQLADAAQRAEDVLKQLERWKP